MNELKKIALVVVCAFIMSEKCCGSSYYVSVDRGGSRGLIDKDGRVVIQPTYKNASLSKGSWVLWNTLDKVRLVSEGRDMILGFDLNIDGLLKCYMLGTNHMCFKYLEKSCIVKLAGDGKHSYYWFDSVGQNYSNKLIPVKKDEDWYLLNEDMKLVKFVSCARIRSFSNSGMAVFLDKKERKYGYISTDGEILNQPIYSLATNYINGVALVRIGEVISMINSKFEVISEVQIDSFKPPLKQSKGIIIQSGKKWGLVGLDGKWILPPKYDWLTTLTKNGGLGCRNGFLYLIDKYGTESLAVKDEGYKVMIDDGRNLILMKNEKGLKYVNRKGKTIWEQKND